MGSVGGKSNRRPCRRVRINPLFTRFQHIGEVTRQDVRVPDPLETFFTRRRPTAEYPLLGPTILIVEDSRFASEALRLLCLRSGARIRNGTRIDSSYG